MQRNTLAPASIAITIVLAAMLGGCAQTDNSTTSDRADDKDKQEVEVQEQSAADACLELADASTEVGGAITDASAILATDPVTAAADITVATSTFEEAIDEIENEEVREAAAPITLGLTHFAEAIELFAADPVAENLDGLTAASDEIQEAFGAITDVCQ